MFGSDRGEVEPGPGRLVHVLQHALLLVVACALLAAAAFPFTWQLQTVIGVVTVLLAMWVDRGFASYLATLTLVFVSVCATFRYAWWRIGTTVAFFHHPGVGLLQGSFVVALLLAEGYAALTLLLGYMQTLWPLRRMPVTLPEDTRDWPSVDLLIPTLNEPLSILRCTALAAANIDWPADKLNVYILDDGDREEFRSFAEEAGIGYLARQGKEHAKAGNLNSALKQLSAEFVAVFDCDHVPTRSFLQITMGWFLRDEKLGLLQTPQHLYSPDPFDRNLDQFRTVPSEDELFYGIVQDGNDFWNSALFRGSCAVLRRSALDEIGGVAQETLTEDVHTSLRLQMGGWNTAYINIPQAAGLATESLDDHVRQRIRWARGMIQILRLENPLFARGLTLAQRLCYFQAMSQFLYALPRLIFLAAPLAYLILGSTVLPGSWTAILAFALPHLLLSNMVNSRIQGQHRHSFWTEVYETILAPYLLLPTIIGLVSPRRGRFEVTPKGGVVSKPYFDGKTAIPFLIMTALQLVGLGFGWARLFHSPWWPFLWSHPVQSAGTVVMYMVWALFNLVILGVCSSVAWESQQRRTNVRILMAVPVDVLFADGTLEEGLTADLSNSGVALRIDESLKVQQGEQVRLIFRDGESALPATVVDSDAGVVRAQFDPLTIDEEEALTVLLYSRADTWLGWSEERDADRPLKSIGNLMGLAMRGFWQTLSAAWEAVLPPGKAKLAGSAVQMGLIAAVFLGLTAATAQFGSAKLKTAETKAVDQNSQGSVDRAPKVNDDLVAGKGEVATQPLLDDLKQLPRPFFDAGLKAGPPVAIVFLSEPSHEAIKAAGIVASWLGIEAKGSPVHFSVSFGTIPQGNAILIAENPADLSPELHIDEGIGPAVSMRMNPEDASSKLLVISGNSGAETVQAAAGLALSGERLEGDQVRFADLQWPPLRGWNDAPRGATLRQAGPWVEMPDLRLFADSGFPFTRRADLSETAVVMTGELTPEGMELYLALMGRFGELTGYPVLNVAVTDADGLKTDADKDYLVLDTAQDREVMRKLDSSLPVLLDRDGLRLRDVEGFFAPVQHAWWRLGSWSDAGKDRIDVSGESPDGLIEEAEWPAHSKRSVVLIAMRDRLATENFSAIFLAGSRSADIARSVSLLRGQRFSSYRVGGEMYHVGELPPWLKTKAILARFPWILAMADFLVSFLLAVLVRGMLRRRARCRLLVTA